MLARSLHKSAVDFPEYTADNHQSWNIVFSQAMRAWENDRFCALWPQNVRLLGFHRGGVPSTRKLNALLMQLTGWQMVDVQEYQPDELTFVNLFAHKKFPRLLNVRSLSEASGGRAMAPDMCHDDIGHAAQIADIRVSRMIQLIGKKCATSIGTPEFTFWTRLFVNIFEFGLQEWSGTIQGFGGAIASSPEELTNALTRYNRKKTLRVSFDASKPHNLRRIMMTDIHFSELQETYFVVRNWKSLMQILQPDFDLRETLKGLEKSHVFMPGERCKKDEYI